MLSSLPPSRFPPLGKCPFIVHPCSLCTLHVGLKDSVVLPARRAAGGAWLPRDVLDDHSRPGVSWVQASPDPLLPVSVYVSPLGPRLFLIGPKEYTWIWGKSILKETINWSFLQYKKTPSHPPDSSFVYFVQSRKTRFQTDQYFLHIGLKRQES